MRQFLLNWLIALLLWAGNFGIVPAAADPIDPELESAVLQIVQQHPEAILNSLIEYQQSQATAPPPVSLKMSQMRDWIGASPVQGELATAKAILIEFSDFQCPYCAAAAPQVRSFLEQHPEVAFVYKHLPLQDLHPEAISAAKAAWAAGQQGKFWQYHDALFAQTKLTPETYAQLAQQLEIDLDQFERDRESEQAEQSLLWEVGQSQAFNISATPTFVVVTQELSVLVSGANLNQIAALLLANS